MGRNTVNLVLLAVTLLCLCMAAEGSRKLMSTCTVVGDGVRIRLGPSTSATAMGMMFSGDTVDVVDTISGDTYDGGSNQWAVVIRLPKKFKGANWVGYIAANYLNC